MKGGDIELPMPKHPFKWKGRAGSRHLQNARKKCRKGEGEPGTLVNTSKLARESRYHSPDPLVHLLGHANKTRVLIDGWR